MNNIHDETFKQLMNQHNFAVAFFKQYLPETIKQKVDWNALKLLKLSGDHTEEKTGMHTFSDLIFEIKTVNNKTLWIHIEHQTRSENFMPLRIAQYQSSALVGYLKNNKTQKIPPIMSIIFHQGKRRYSHSLDFKNIFTDPELGIKYFGNPILIDLPALPDEAIKQHSGIGPVELLLKHIRMPDFVKQKEQLIAGLRPLDENTRLTMLKYIMKCSDVSVEQLLETIRQYLPKDEEAIMTTEEQIMQRGMQNATHMVARNMLQEGYDPQAVKKVTHLSDQEIQKLRESEKE